MLALSRFFDTVDAKISLSLSSFSSFSFSSSYCCCCDNSREAIMSNYRVESPSSVRPAVLATTREEASRASERASERSRARALGPAGENQSAPHRPLLTNPRKSEPAATNQLGNVASLQGSVAILTRGCVRLFLSGGFMYLFRQHARISADDGLSLSRTLLSAILFLLPPLLSPFSLSLLSLSRLSSAADSLARSFSLPVWQRVDASPPTACHFEYWPSTVSLASYRSA